MIDVLFSTIKILGALLPFLLFVYLSNKANLKKAKRSRQFAMPIIAFVLCVVLVFTAERISAFLAWLLNAIPGFLADLAEKAGELLGGSLADILNSLGNAFRTLLDTIHLDCWMFIILNTAVMLVYIIVKRIVTAVLGRVFRPGSTAHDAVASFFYESDEGTGAWYVKSHFEQARTYLKTFYYAAVIISVLLTLISAQLYRVGALVAPFYPIFSIVLIGEMYFYLDGFSKQEIRENIEGEDDSARGVYNYALLRSTMKKLFGDKLIAESTAVCDEMLHSDSNDALLHELESDSDPAVEAYAAFMRSRVAAGLHLDQNYLHSGLDLLKGKSILFNDPFYYDLIPYAFYAINRVLLRHKKVLIVLGRHGTQEDVTEWCREGLSAISNIPDLWRIGVLSGKEQDLDVGIVTRSSVHDFDVHRANRAMFQQVEFVVLIEPSRLITTAQVGLHSLISECSVPGKTITYCSTDKNCDGLVDALSHVLMTSISEVSATNRHTGISSYMCWEADTEHLQHRMLPNLSRYLGIGTEMSFVALKNQISTTRWYGGDAFPVTDMHWIVGQYYYDLLAYAGLPANQETIERCFVTSPNMWNERTRKVSYLTVEDESNNMFEIKRDFATRATSQSFINIISSDYLLRDYMAENDGVFLSDAKAIPYIVADYARTRRNVVLRLCLRMCSGELPRDEIERDLTLVGMDTNELTDALWHEICSCFSSADDAGKDELHYHARDGREFTFQETDIIVKRRYSLASGRMEDSYTITDEHFREILLDDMQNTRYIAEEENGEGIYLGSELRGHIFQKYLPGQFFTFDGKYYEMLSLAPGGQVLVRRAADHINGRPSYRQVREYDLTYIRDAEAMGSSRVIGGMRVTRRFADFCVKTPAYWSMPRYHDFENARRVEINGIPEREYRNKQVLRIDFPELGDQFTDKIRFTVTLLFNEVFRTLFVENQPYIVALTPGEVGVPLTYELKMADDSDRNAIYIIEDSQLDMGLLIAVERNIDRIFSIICDYLDWHLTALEESRNPAPEQQPPEYALPEPEPELTRWQKFKKKVKNFFSKIFSGRKKRGKKGSKPEEAEIEETLSGSDDEAQAMQNDGERNEAANAESETDETEADEPDAGEAVSEPADPDAVEAENSPVESDIAETEDDGPDAGEAVSEPADPDAVEAENGPVESDIAETEEKTVESDAADPETEGLDADKVPEQEENGESDEGPSVLLSISGPKMEDSLEFEPDSGKKMTSEPKRTPYYERYYLLYGGNSMPENIDPEGTLAFLNGLGYGDGSLKQARKGKKIAELVEQNYEPGHANRHYCDFCGDELIGTE